MEFLIRKQRILLSLLLLIVLLIAVTVTDFSFYRNSIVIELLSPQYDDIYQVFYDTGKGYNERDSVGIEAKEGNGVVKLQFYLPNKLIKGFRIDPGTHKTNLIIKSIRLELFERNIFRFFKSAYSKIWHSDEIITCFRPLHHISDFSENNGNLYLKSTGNDPYLEYIGDFFESKKTIHIYNKSISVCSKFYPFIFCIILAACFYLLYTKIKKGGMAVLRYCFENEYAETNRGNEEHLNIKNNKPSEAKHEDTDNQILFDKKLQLLRKAIINCILLIAFIAVSFLFPSEIPFSIENNLVSKNDDKHIHINAKGIDIEFSSKNIGFQIDKLPQNIGGIIFHIASVHETSFFVKNVTKERTVILLREQLFDKHSKFVSIKTDNSTTKLSFLFSQKTTATNQILISKLKIMPSSTKRLSDAIKGIILLLILPFVFFHFFFEFRYILIKDFRLDFEYAYYLLIITALLFFHELLFEISYVTLLLFPLALFIERIIQFFLNENKKAMYRTERIRYYVYLAYFVLFLVIAWSLCFKVPFGVPPDESQHFRDLQKCISQQTLLPSNLELDFPFLQTVAYLFYPFAKHISKTEQYIFFRLINLLMYLITLSICFRFIRKQSWGIYGDVIFWTTLVNIPIFVFMAGSYNYDAGFVLFASLFIYSLYRFLRKGYINYLLIYFLSALVITLTKPNGIPFFVFFLLTIPFFFFLPRYRKSFIRFISKYGLLASTPLIYLCLIILVIVISHFYVHGTSVSNTYITKERQSVAKDSSQGEKLNIFQYDDRALKIMKIQLSGLCTHKPLYRKHLVSSINWFFIITTILSFIYLIKNDRINLSFLLPLVLLVLFYHAAHIGTLYLDYMLSDRAFSQASKQVRYYICFVTIIPTIITYGVYSIVKILKRPLKIAFLFCYVILFEAFGGWFLFYSYLPFVLS